MPFYYRVFPTWFAEYQGHYDAVQSSEYGLVIGSLSKGLVHTRKLDSELLYGTASCILQLRCNEKMGVFHF